MNIKTDAQAPVVAVTGSSGLIGTRLQNALQSEYRVIGLDVQPPPQDAEDVEWIETDLTSDASVDEAFQTIRAKFGDHLASFVHLAAYYDFSGEPSPLYDELTVEGTRRILQALQSFDVEQFIFSSSLLVMEPSESAPLTEESPIRAEWDYPQSKLAAEQVIATRRGEVPAVILRLAGVYDEEGHSIPITQQIRRIYEKDLESYFFPGNEEYGQSFIHLSDAVECIRQTIERRAELGQNEVFLIGEEEVMSYGDLQDEIGRLLHGKEWPTIRIPKFAAKAGAWVQGKLVSDESEEPFIKPWMIDLADQNYPVSIQRAEQKLRWSPVHRLRESLPAMIDNLRQDPVAWYERNKLPLPEELAKHS